MTDPTFQFRTIDLEKHRDTCIEFRRDSFVVSFGSDARFEDLGVEKYVDWLDEEIASLPDGFVHVWDGDTIVGQIEARVVVGPPPRGYVNLYYLVPAYRGRRLGDQLDIYVKRLFRARGVIEARLTVSESNEAARCFYERRGWLDIGPRPGQDGSRLMQRMFDLEPS